MNLSMIGYIVGCVIEIEAVLMLLPALVGLIYREQNGICFLLCALVAALVGLACCSIKRGHMLVSR